MRIACFYLPNFSLQTEWERRTALKGRPVIVVYSPALARQEVLDFSPELKGVQVGMPLQEALSHSQGAVVVEADMPYYHEVFERVLKALEHCGPAVEAEGLGCAYLDLTGLENLYGGREGLKKALVDVIPPPFYARVGIGQGKFPARAVLSVGSRQSAVGSRAVEQSSSQAVRSGTLPGPAGGRQSGDVVAGLQPAGEARGSRQSAVEQSVAARCTCLAAGSHQVEDQQPPDVCEPPASFSRRRESRHSGGGICSPRSSACAPTSNLLLPTSECGGADAPTSNLSLLTSRIWEVEGDVTEFLRDRQVDLLPVLWKTKQRLHSFGLHTLGQIASLPPGPLQAQFGPEGKTIWELARGIDNRPLIPRRSEETVPVGLSFPEATASLGVIFLAVENLLRRAFALPELKGRYARGVILQSQVSGGVSWERRLSFREPVGDKKRVLFIIKSALDGVVLPGPLEDLRLTLFGLTGEVGQQESFFSEVHQREQLGKALRQLETRLGKPPPIYQVRSLEPWSRIPERRQALVRFSA